MYRDPQDRCTKNHIYVREYSGRWTIIPYDVRIF